MTTYNAEFDVSGDPDSESLADELMRKNEVRVVSKEREPTNGNWTYKVQTEDLHDLDRALTDLYNDPDQVEEVIMNAEPKPYQTI